LLETKRVQSSWAFDAPVARVRDALSQSDSLQASRLVLLRVNMSGVVMMSRRLVAALYDTFIKVNMAHIKSRDLGN
jgi:hypothetical protein